jgi:nitrogen fixation protein NifU and related proteins
MDDLYREILLDHHRNPRNYGSIINPDITKRDSNPLCGDDVEIFASVKDDVLTKIKFEGKGCIICMAASSILTEELEGKNIDFVNNLTREDWLDVLGAKLTAARVKCAMLPLVVLKKGIIDFEVKK